MFLKDKYFVFDHLLALVSSKMIMSVFSLKEMKFGENISGLFFLWSPLYEQLLECVPQTSFPCDFKERHDHLGRRIYSLTTCLTAQVTLIYSEVMRFSNKQENVVKCINWCDLSPVCCWFGSLIMKALYRRLLSLFRSCFVLIWMCSWYFNPESAFVR